MWLALLAPVAAAVVGGAPGGDPAAVALGATGGVTCTGVALAPRSVLTAAHCVELLDGDPAAVVLADGADRRFVGTDTHPDYDGAADHDLALVEVDGDLPWWRPFGGASVPAPDDRITFTGFGATADGADDAGTRRTGELGILDVDPTTLLAYDAAANLCSGDSGAPGLVDGELVAIGTGIVPTCLGGQTIGTLLAPAADWITSIVPEAPPPVAEPPCCTEDASGCGCATGGTPGILAVALAAAAALRQRATSTSRTGSARSCAPSTARRP
jgi:MYXO-CTERM domain-containing protein